MQKRDYYSAPEPTCFQKSKFYSSRNTGWQYAEVAKEKNLRFRRKGWPKHFYCFYCVKRENYYFSDGREVPLDVGYEQNDWHFLEYVNEALFCGK